MGDDTGKGLMRGIRGLHILLPLLALLAVASQVATCGVSVEVDPEIPRVKLDVPITVTDANGVPIENAFVMIVAKEPWLRTTDKFLAVVRDSIERWELGPTEEHGRGSALTDAAGRAVVRCVGFIPSPEGRPGEVEWPSHLEIGIYAQGFEPLYRQIQNPDRTIARNPMKGWDYLITVHMGELRLRRG